MRVPVAGVPRAMFLDPSGHLRISLGQAWQIADLDPKQGRIVNTVGLPTKGIDAAVTKDAGRSVKIVSRDVMGAALFQNRLFVAAVVQTEVAPYAFLLDVERDVAYKLSGDPAAPAVVNSLLLVPLVGSANLAVFDGRAFRELRIGGGPRAVLGYKDRILVTAIESDELVVVDRGAGRVLERHKLPWRRPAALALWKNSILVTAEGTMEAPAGALITIAAPAAKPAVVKLDFAHAGEVVVLGDTAFVTSVDHHLVGSVDLVKNRQTGRHPTARYPGAMALVP